MNRGKDLPALSDAQLEIMQLVWERGEATVSDVWTALSEQRPVARNTVLTLMDRLEKRGWLRKRRVGNTDLFKATRTQQSALRGIVKRFVNTTFAGSADALVLSLLEGRGVTEEEAERIRQMLDESKHRKGGR